MIICVWNQIAYGLKFFISQVSKEVWVVDDSNRYLERSQSSFNLQYGKAKGIEPTRRATHTYLQVPWNYYNIFRSLSRQFINLKLRLYAKIHWCTSQSYRNCQAPRKIFLTLFRYMIFIALSSTLSAIRSTRWHTSAQLSRIGQHMKDLVVAFTCDSIGWWQKFFQERYLPLMLYGCSLKGCL